MYEAKVGKRNVMVIQQKDYQELKPPSPVVSEMGVGPGGYYNSAEDVREQHPTLCGVCGVLGCAVGVQPLSSQLVFSFRWGRDAK